MSSQKISGVVITLNEEEVIARCLSSLSKVCDEIIVVDSNSSDGTESICQSFEKVTFVKSEWLGYSQTKNKGAQLASHTNIISLDADECLDEVAISKINSLNREDLCDSYSINRKNFYSNKWVKYGGWYPDVKIRLYNKNVNRWEGDFVHETLVSNPGTLTTHLEGNIEHYTIRKHSDHMVTIHKYAKLAAQRDKEQGKKSNVLSAMVSAIIHFIKIYFIKSGWLDGFIGFRVALNSARSKWLRYKYHKAL
jgi:glycosyltransferase involved in cell wall biosynthesis